MAYSEFKLKDVKTRFNLTVVENVDLFSETPSVAVEDALANTLTENVPLALAVNTEKARSELIIAPVLVEVRRLLDRRISLFSGIELTVDQSAGLNGVCDFIIGSAAEQFYLSAPVITIVEAKKEDLVGGIGQCLAEMVAARIFNEREGLPGRTVFGAVTSGSAWKFLKLETDTAYVDVPEYYIADVGKILGVLTWMTGLSL
jgi:hypothetical protein